MSWSRSQCVEFARDIRDAWHGKPWTMLTEELREAIISERALRVVLGQDESKPTIAIADIEALRDGIRKALGDRFELPVDDEHRAQSIAARAQRRTP